MKDVLQRNCQHCMSRKSTKKMTKVLHWQPITAMTPNERHQIDLIDLSSRPSIVRADPQFGVDVTMKYVLVAIDIFSKFLWLFSLPDKRPERIIQRLEVLYQGIGYPGIIQCDNGKEFIALRAMNFWTEKQVTVSKTSTYSPEQNGQVSKSPSIIQASAIIASYGHSRSKEALVLSKTCWTTCLPRTSKEAGRHYCQMLLRRTIPNTIGEVAAFHSKSTMGDLGRGHVRWKSWNLVRSEA